MLGGFTRSNLFSPMADPLTPNEYPHSHCTDEKTVVGFISQKDHSDSTGPYGSEEAEWEAGRPMSMSVNRLIQGLPGWREGSRGGMDRIWWLIGQGDRTMPGSLSQVPGVGDIPEMNNETGGWRFGYRIPFWMS